MIKRKIEHVLREKATTFSVVTLTGPRQSGKSTLCQMVFPDYQYINLEDLNHRKFATEDPAGFIEQYSGGVILDEIQRVPELTSQIQVHVDQTKKKGEFILTGSHNFSLLNSINQSLAGRTALLTLLPFSLAEVQSYGTEFNLNDYLYQGFYPKVYEEGLNPTDLLADYIATYIERDLREIENIKNLSAFQKFMGLCAGRIGQPLVLSDLANEVGVSHHTLKNWLSILEASYIIYLLRPYSKNINKRIVKSPKLYFYDVGIASYLLGIRKVEHLQNHPLSGFLFENLVVIEALKQNFNHNAHHQFYFYRDTTGNEVDLVVDRGIELLPIEIKKSQTYSTHFFKGITRFEKVLKQEFPEKLVVYGGVNKQQHQNRLVVPYKKLETVKRD